jgi:hypothetical protein
MARSPGTVGGDTAGNSVGAGSGTTLDRALTEVNHMDGSSTGTLMANAGREGLFQRSEGRTRTSGDRSRSSATPEQQALADSRAAQQHSRQAQQNQPSTAGVRKKHFFEKPNWGIRNIPFVANVVQVFVTPITTGLSQINKPIASAASTMAKERTKMLETVDKLLTAVLGKDFVKPADHRGYTALVAKAVKKITNPKQLEEFKTKIEEAGKPFRLNFGLSRTTGGKKVALNSNVQGTFNPLYQAEQQRFAAQFQNRTAVASTPGRNTTAPAAPTTPRATPATTEPRRQPTLIA